MGGVLPLNRFSFNYFESGVQIPDMGLSEPLLNFMSSTTNVGFTEERKKTYCKTNNDLE